MLIAALPRLRFAHLPTPLEPMERLTRYLDGPRLFVKRDDCTGLAGGGNKTRKLEFLLAEALVRKSDLVITQGAAGREGKRAGSGDRSQAPTSRRDPGRGGAGG